MKSNRFNLLFRYWLFIGASILALRAHAQTSGNPPPKREVRAVWITTMGGLDWPRSADKAEQQSSLARIVATLKAANFNTIFFQVRARGDAYYHSSYEPWAENLTGTLGKDPGWDPLQFLLSEAHRVGIEVHAWFNVYKIRGANPVGPSIPPHPSRFLSAWTVPYGGELWLDPGVPDVKTYLLRVALELVRMYDLDGINFDFARYPGRDFPDDETYRRYGNGINRDDWRRSNVTRFITEFYDRAMSSKPMLKVGSSPLGVYQIGRNGESGGSYSQYYQDSRGWLHARKQDYLSPQLYWAVGTNGGEPDFSRLVQEWQTQSEGRQIYAGVGAFKEEVLQQLPMEIDSARACGAAGEAFYRYENLRTLNTLGQLYETPANIPSMAWKDPVPPLPPTNLAVSEVSPSIFELEWTPPHAASDGDTARYYNVYRWRTPDIPFDNPNALAAITCNAENSVIDTVRNAGGLVYYYAVSSFDKGNNESRPSAVIPVVVREALALKGKLETLASLTTAVSAGSGLPTLAGYHLSDRMSVSLELLRRTMAGNESLVTTLVHQVQDKGTYVVGLRGALHEAGVYVLRLTAGGTRLEQAIQVRAN